ncbi:glycosyl hydrolase family 28 protein [Paenibacillus allorhizosphaerae]|uniref:Endo-polygalacturonase n=1 Tax=Paenibacillus allorhizosphaerae TaxID=2849866 RepID=A0ABM8VA63_9BACL|nr:glycosyl hydrolase family 28 protein [Paenibacillus allorhizosphaerae]CAG7615585.1 hypothetical protein PAECIP111802_00187 [Paenibacillus allorhizosphaerae]
MPKMILAWMMLFAILLPACDAGSPAAATDPPAAPLTEQKAGDSKVITYPGPEQAPDSPFYSVAVRQGQELKDSFTYISKNQFPRVNIYSEDTSWTTFSFSGKVTVVVTSKDNKPIQSCSILPSHLGIKPRINGHQVEFDLDAPAKLSVELNGQIKHPLLVFADPPETEPVPKPGPNVLYFPPGVHDVGRVELKSGQTVYIAGGAYVKGYFDGGTNKTDITIRGRGILSGEAYEHKAHHMIEIMGNQTRNIRIEGITIINSPWTHIRMWGQNNTVRNVKMISWYYNTDGILLGSDSLIEDCFFKLNDDAVKLYHSGIVVRNCVLWQLMNGAPFQLTWNVSVPTSNVLVTNCDVIRVEHYKDWDNRAVFNSIHGGTGHLSNYVFQNMTIENANFRFVKLIFLKTKFNEEQIGYGNISDITFRNINIINEMKEKSILQGYDAEHGIRNVTFENVTINNKPLTIDRFEVDSASVKDVKVIPGYGG